jgi:hypothetical protein
MHIVPHLIRILAADGHPIFCQGIAGLLADQPLPAGSYAPKGGTRPVSLSSERRSKPSAAGTHGKRVLNCPRRNPLPFRQGRVSNGSDSANPPNRTNSHTAADKNCEQSSQERIHS